MTVKALRARVVYPVAAPPIEDAIVVIDNGRVRRVGRQAPAGVEVEDLGNVALMPGLVNSHCHLEFSSLKRRVGRKGISLPKWIRQVMEKRPTGKNVGKSIQMGLEESLQHGVTTIAEISRTETKGYHIDGPSPRLVLLQEAIGFSQARANSALNATKNRIDEIRHFVHTLPNYDLGAADFARRAAEGNTSVKDSKWINGRYQVGVSPHAPYTASPQLIRELVSVAVERDMPVALHLAESPEELQLLDECKGPFQEILEERSMWDPWVIQRGSGPMDYLRILTRAPKSLVVHGNYLDQDALAMMARHAGAMSLVYCPRTHEHFKHKDYPLVEAVELGVRVCLGTDSRASNPDLSLLSEMRFVAANYPQISAEAILRMGTLSGAEALGLSDVGAIRPDAQADMISIPLVGDLDGRPDELLSGILASSEPVESIWLGGTQITQLVAN